jgi:hypothetical protein
MISDADWDFVYNGVGGASDPLRDAIKACKNWTQITENILKNAAPLSSGELHASIRGRVKVRNNEPYAISYSFLRYGVWIEKGAGNGAGGQVGSTWKDKHGNRKTTRRSSLGKAGAIRPYNEWFDHVIDDRLEVLCNLIARHTADGIIFQIKLR